MEQFKRKKDEEETEEQHGAAQLTVWQRYKSWILIAAAITVIVVLAVIQASPTSEDPKLTLASLNKTVATLNQSVDSRVSLVESRTVWHTNQISEIEDSIQSMAANITSLPDWTGVINTLQSRLTAAETTSTSLQAQLNEMSHNSTAYAVITGMSPPNINAEVYGSGNFTVILTLYGSGMLNSTVFNFYPGNYTIGGIYLAGNTTMAICLDAAWNNDEIKLAVSGCAVDYASATIGGS